MMPSLRSCICPSYIDSKNGNCVRLLFIDYSSAFNTIFPIKLDVKLSDLGLNTSLCDWIQDLLTGRPQVVKMGQFTSNSITLNVGVLNLLSLHTRWTSWLGDLRQYGSAVIHPAPSHWTQGPPKDVCWAPSSSLCWPTTAHHHTTLTFSSSLRMTRLWWVSLATEMRQTTGVRWAT